MQNNQLVQSPQENNKQGINKQTQRIRKERKMKIKERKEQINTSKTSRLCYRPACLPRVVAFYMSFYKVVR